MAEQISLLVTGGAGFIGSHFVRYALRHHPHWEVRVLDRLTYAGHMENLDAVMDRITFIQGDVADPPAVRQAMKGCRYVVNFAAESHVDRSLKDPAPFAQTNVLGTLVLLEAAHHGGVRRFLQISTDEVYGELPKGSPPSREGDPFRPRSPYAAAKAGAEHLVMSFATSFGMDAVFTRGANTYGPNQHPEKIIPLFIVRALTGGPLPVYGDGLAVRDYLHVLDHCRGIDRVLMKGAPGEAYNLGTRSQIPALEVARRIVHLAGAHEDQIAFVADRPGHDQRYEVDPGRAESLGWSAQIPFEDGLRRTFSWYRSHRSWWEPLLTRAR